MIQLKLIIIQYMMINQFNFFLLIKNFISFNQILKLKLILFKNLSKKILINFFSDHKYINQ